MARRGGFRAKGAAYRRATMRNARALAVARHRRASASWPPNARACRRSASRGGRNSSTATRSRSARRGVRLFGVDAPEGRQSCTRDGREWACGDEAAAQAAPLVGDRTVSCTRRDVDTYGRIVAVCRSGTDGPRRRDGARGIRTAYRRYSDDYVDEENEARAARRGIWAGEFTSPEDYRRDDRREAPAQRSGARRSATGLRRLLHQRQHQRRRRAHLSRARLAVVRQHRIDESKGERWFRTESEARAAGWRAPRG